MLQTWLHSDLCAFFPTTLLLPTSQCDWFINLLIVNTLFPTDPVQPRALQQGDDPAVDVADGLELAILYVQTNLSSHVHMTAVCSHAGVRSSRVTTPQRLRKAALHILHYGCAEGWLLQFKIP